MLTDDSVSDRRINSLDRRKLKTYLSTDRRSGLADRRAKTSELIRRVLYGYKSERRRAHDDRRRLNTYIMNDRRSGVIDRRTA
jgi:hypothetical protein